MDIWQSFVDNLKHQSGKLAKDELAALVHTAKADSEPFIQKQGEKLELYLNQLAVGAITKEQFRAYVEDIRDLTEMKLLQMSVVAKLRAQRFVEGVGRLAIDGLIEAL